MQQIDVIQECPKIFHEKISLCLQLCRYHFEEETQYGYRFVWKQDSHTIATEKTGIPSVSAMLQLSALAIEEGWGQFSAENKEEIESFVYSQNAVKLQEEFPKEQLQRFPIGGYVLRGSTYFKILSNEDDFIGRAVNMQGELTDPFYFDYNGESSQKVTDPEILQQLEEEITLLQLSQFFTREWMEEVGFQLNAYPSGKCYELNVTDFDRATEIAELAGVKFDKLSGVHHVILQCNEAFSSCFFLCDNDYWEVAPDVFSELVKKLAMS